MMQFMKKYVIIHYKKSDAPLKKNNSYPLFLAPNAPWLLPQRGSGMGGVLSFAIHIHPVFWECKSMGLPLHAGSSWHKW